MIDNCSPYILSKALVNRSPLPSLHSTLSPPPHKSPRPVHRLRGTRPRTVSHRLNFAGRPQCIANTGSPTFWTGPAKVRWQPLQGELASAWRGAGGRPRLTTALCALALTNPSVEAIQGFREWAQRANMVTPRANTILEPGTGNLSSGPSLLNKQTFL